MWQHPLAGIWPSIARSEIKKIDISLFQRLHSKGLVNPHGGTVLRIHRKQQTGPFALARHPLGEANDVFSPASATIPWDQAHIDQFQLFKIRVLREDKATHWFLLVPYQKPQIRNVNTGRAITGKHVLCLTKSVELGTVQRLDIGRFDNPYKFCVIHLRPGNKLEITSWRF